jgi:hypothetical protein
MLVNFVSTIPPQYLFSDVPASSAVASSRVGLGIEEWWWTLKLSDGIDSESNTDEGYDFEDVTPYLLIFEVDGQNINALTNNLYSTSWNLFVDPGSVVGEFSLVIGKYGHTSVKHLKATLQKFLIYEKLLTVQQKTDLFTATGL